MEEEGVRHGQVIDSGEEVPTRGPSEEKKKTLAQTKF